MVNIPTGDEKDNLLILSLGLLEKVKKDNQPFQKLCNQHTNPACGIQITQCSDYLITNWRISMFQPAGSPASGGLAGLFPESYRDGVE
ncbi:MAG: hypothetical protein IPH20_23475 [Bacteroidales bacterium]|nr:hypothetical protein [Bacteroidales bacterium]